jgi:branched-chain amino acid transport system ATP-binding protein
VLLPIGLQAVGLTWDNATVVVLLAIAAMGLNLLVGYHRAGVVRPQRLVRHRRLCGGAVAEALVPGAGIVLPLLFSLAFTAAAGHRGGLPDPAPARRLLLAADAGAVAR